MRKRVIKGWVRLDGPNPQRYLHASKRDAEDAQLYAIPVRLPRRVARATLTVEVPERRRGK